MTGRVSAIRGCRDAAEPTARTATACRDRDDTLFPQLCLASHADPLVSGNADLTVLARAYPVASPTMLRERLKDG